VVQNLVRESHSHKIGLVDILEVHTLAGMRESLSVPNGLIFGVITTSQFMLGQGSKFEELEKTTKET